MTETSPDARELYLRGRSFLREGDFEKARKYFEDSMKAHPAGKEAAFYIALAWEKQGEFLMAQQAYEKFLETSPLDKKAWERLYGLYEKVRNWNDFHEFFEKKRSGINKTGLKVWLLEKIALTYLTEGKLERAENCYRELLAFKPGYPYAIINLAKVYQVSERHDAKALEILMRACELEKGETSLVLYTARVLRMAGRKDESSMKVYRAAFDIDPWDQANNIYLKILFFERDETSHPLALKLYNRLIDEGHKDGELYFHRGLIWKEKSDWEKGSVDFSLALELGYSCEKHYPSFELAYCYYKVSNYRFSAEKLKIHLKKYPDHQDGWKLAGKVFFSRHFKWKDEDFLFAESIASRLPSYQMYLTLADYAKNKMEDFSLAEKLYVKALNLNPNLPVVLKELEDIYCREKNWISLEAIYASQITQFAGKKDKKVYYLYKLADLKWRQVKDYDKAREIYKEILTIAPEETRVYLELAEFAENTGTYGEGKKLLRNLLIKDICNKDAYYLMGRLFYKEGKSLMTALSYGILKLLDPENKQGEEFFSKYSFPAIREGVPWDRENEDLLIHREEKKLISLLSMSRIWCEKVYSPQISDEVLQNASMTGESHRPDMKDMVSWCSKLTEPGEINSYIYYGDKSSFPVISGISSEESYIIFHNTFLSSLEQRELLFLIAHEVCHIKREHYLYYRLKGRLFDWTLGLTSDFFSKISGPLSGIWKNRGKTKDLENLDFEVALLGLDFTADRYGLFFCNDIYAASQAIWKKYSFSKKKNLKEVDFKKLVSNSRGHKEITLRLNELWAFAMSYEYEMEMHPITLF